MTPHTNRSGPAAGPGEDPLDRLMAERGTHLLHAAIALTGSRAEAEDLLQAAVERLLRRRRPVDDLEAYLRRILYNPGRRRLAQAGSAGWPRSCWPATPARRTPQTARPGTQTSLWCQARRARAVLGFC